MYSGVGEVRYGVHLDHLPVLFGARPRDQHPSQPGPEEFHGRPGSGVGGTLLGLVPFLFATGPGSEVQRPLAIVVIGGLITSTFLSLLVIPVVFTFVDDLIDWTHRLVRRKGHTEAAVSEG